jgi:hypothetical protein
MALLALVWVIPDIFIYNVLHASGLLAETVVRIAFISGLVLIVAYPIYFIGKRGQTPGMKLLRIRLYRLGPDGELYATNNEISVGRWAIVMLFNLLSGALFGIPIISTICGPRGTDSASAYTTRRSAQSRSTSESECPTEGCPSTPARGMPIGTRS